MQTATLAVQTCEIQFDEGIIGVPRARRFELLECDDSPVRILRSLDIQNFALPVVDPLLADANYAPRLHPRIVRALELEHEDSLLMLSVATLEPAGPVANLRAPLIINVEKRIGFQVILDDRSLPLRAPVEVAC